MAKFEVFESSSDDELSQGAFESAANSYQKRQDRLQEREEDESELLNDSVAERERRLKDRLKRQERKRLEKKRREREQDREKRKKELRD